MNSLSKPIGYFGNKFHICPPGHFADSQPRHSHMRVYEEDGDYSEFKSATYSKQFSVKTSKHLSKKCDTISIIKKTLN
jgi:hypothetical protein